MKKNIPHIIRLFSAFVVLFTSVNSSGQNLDINILRNINSGRSASGDKVMTGFTNSVYPASVALPIAELIVGYARHDKQTVAYGWQTVAGLGINAIVTFGLKDAISRPRPYITYPDIRPYQHLTDASFPSGHTSFSFCSAASVSLCYPRWYVILPSYLWAASVGYSRMYLGMHYPTDVLAGAVVGTGSAWLAYKGNKWLWKRKNKRATIQRE